MKTILTITLLVLTIGTLSSQKRYLVSPTEAIYELAPGQGALSLIDQLSGADRATSSPICTDRATFGYPASEFPLTGLSKAYHKDVIGQWFVAKAAGTIDTVFWYMPGEINTYDSTLYFRFQQTYLGPDFGPGIRPGPYDPPCQSWGYWINWNDPDQGVAAFLEEATDTTWVSTINGPVPSTAPFPLDSWGWGTVAVRAHPGVNSLDFGILGSPDVTPGDKFFISLRVNFNPADFPGHFLRPEYPTEFGLSGYSISTDDDDYPSRSWIFREHDGLHYSDETNIPEGIDDGGDTLCAGIPLRDLRRGWMARGGMGPDSTDVAVYNIWYTMTVTSNVPPVIHNQINLKSTFSNVPRLVQTVVTDCNPAMPAGAGVQTVLIRYSVSGTAQPDIVMTDLGADTWEGNIPGLPGGSIVNYRIVATDIDGESTSGPPVSYMVVPYGNEWYGIDTGYVCVPRDIRNTGTTVNNSEFFIPPNVNPTGSPTDDGTAGPFDMGSTFTVFGDTFRYAWIGVDGAIGLGKSPTDTVGIPDFGGHKPNILPPLDSSSIFNRPGAYISPFRADRVVEDSNGSYGRILYGNDGDSCLFMVEWDSLATSGPDTSLPDEGRFRVILNRCTGSVEFQYDDVGGYGLDSANISGMQADSGALTGPEPAALLSNRLGYPIETRPRDGWCVRFDPTVGTLAQNGWNMVALSAQPIDENYSAAVLFPGVSAKFYCWPFSGECPGTLAPGKGYWMKFPRAGRFGNSAGAFFRENLVPVSDKWNMVGGTSGFVDAASIVPNGTSITTPFWGYGPSGYAIASTLQPGRAYWVKVDGAGTLGMVSAAAVPKPVGTTHKELTSGPTGIMTIVDATGKSQTLYLAREDILTHGREYFELPPEPPAGIFDARFTSQSICEVFPARPEGNTQIEYPVKIRGAVYPVTVSWEMSGLSGEGMRAILRAISGETGVRREMKGSGSIVIRDRKTTTLMIILTPQTGEPAAFSLDQNYPNPFNPTTKITFSLPEPGRVTLTVFDILGRAVATLVDEPREAGVQSVSFDASGLASGIYTYRIVAGTETKTRKMLLLK